MQQQNAFIDLISNLSFGKGRPLNEAVSQRRATHQSRDDNGGRDGGVNGPVTPAYMATGSGWRWRMPHPSNKILTLRLDDKAGGTAGKE
jgi:hypothetical protein